MSLRPGDPRALVCEVFLTILLPGRVDVVLLRQSSPICCVLNEQSPNVQKILATLKRQGTNRDNNLTPKLETSF